MKYVGVCRIKQGKRTEYELSQAEIEDIKQYIPQALREGAASGVCEGSGAVSAVLVLQTIAENLGSMLTPYGIRASTKEASDASQSICEISTSLTSGLLMALGPVSYTHLDVYKRQG